MKSTQATKETNTGRTAMLKKVLCLMLLLLAMGPLTARAAQSDFAAQRYNQACQAATAASQQVQSINARYSAERTAFETGIRAANPQQASQAKVNYERYLGELLRALDQDVFAHQCAETAAYNYLLELGSRPHTFGNNPALKASWLQLREALVRIRGHRNLIDSEIRSLWGRFNAARSGRINLLGR